MLTVVNIFFHVTAILFTFPIEANMKQLWFKKTKAQRHRDQEFYGVLTSYLAVNLV